MTEAEIEPWNELALVDAFSEFHYAQALTNSFIPKRTLAEAALAAAKSVNSLYVPAQDLIIETNLLSTTNRPLLYSLCPLNNDVCIYS